MHLTEKQFPIYGSAVGIIVVLFILFYFGDTYVHG